MTRSYPSLQSHLFLLKYVIIVLKADDNGEGEGRNFALYSLLCRHARVNSLPNCQLADEELSQYKKHSIGSAPKSSFGSRLKSTLEKHRILQRISLVLALIGACMVISDDVLTPVISVFSAVSGLELSMSKEHHKCGLGLTLTKADRVIVVDPAWKLSIDNQSVDRAYRIGQNKDVVVYRLMSCGIVKEKIYRKQLYGIDDAIDKSKKVVSAMSRRMSRNKWIVASVIVALVIAIILILFFKLSHH